MASKIEKLREQIRDARKRRSPEIAKLQEELSKEVAKAAKKGKASATTGSTSDDS